MLFCVGRCGPPLHLQMGKDKDFEGDVIHPGSHVGITPRITVVNPIFQIPKIEDKWLGCCLHSYSVEPALSQESQTGLTLYCSPVWNRNRLSVASWEHRPEFSHVKAHDIFVSEPPG